MKAGKRILDPSVYDETDQHRSPTPSNGSKQQKRMRYWSEAKLYMELAFAAQMTDETDPNALRWREDIKAEIARRGI